MNNQCVGGGLWRDNNIGVEGETVFLLVFFIINNFFFYGFFLYRHYAISRVIP